MASDLRSLAAEHRVALQRDETGKIVIPGKNDPLGVSGGCSKPRPARVCLRIDRDPIQT